MWQKAEEAITSAPGKDNGENGFIIFVFSSTHEVRKVSTNAIPTGHHLQYAHTPWQSLN